MVNRQTTPESKCRLAYSAACLSAAHYYLALAGRYADLPTRSCWRRPSACSRLQVTGQGAAGAMARLSGAATDPGRDRALVDYLAGAENKKARKAGKRSGQVQNGQQLWSL